MNGINKAIIIGTLGRDPESKSGVVKLNIATNHKWKDRDGNMKEETEWHRVTVFGKSGEAAAKYLSKGRQVYVEGRIKTSSYENASVKHYSTQIIADTVQFIGGGKGSGDIADAPQQGGFAPAGDDDIPF